MRPDLEVLLAVLRRLALIEAEKDSRLKSLIEQLAAKAPVDDITDVGIDREVQAVRDAARST